MSCKIDESKNFRETIKTASQDSKKKIDRAISSLQDEGTNLGYPRSSAIKGSKLSLRELRITAGNQEWRILYKFHPMRNPVLLHAGDKTREGDSWYKKNIPVAEKAYLDFLQNDFKRLYPEADIKNEIFMTKKKVQNQTHARTI